MRPAKERIESIREWAHGKYPDGQPHIPPNVSSYTLDLLAEIDALNTQVALLNDLYQIARARIIENKWEGPPDAMRQAVLRLDSFLSNGTNSHPVTAEESK